MFNVAPHTPEDKAILARFPGSFSQERFSGRTAAFLGDFLQSRKETRLVNFSEIYYRPFLDGRV